MGDNWVRVSNGVEDPVTHTAFAQDQVVKVIDSENDWLTIETLEGVSGRVPKILVTPISNPLRSPAESAYCSIAQFDAQNDDDISFQMYTILVVESVESEGWFRGSVVTDTGKRLGSSGTFPATFVKPLSGFQALSQPTTSIPTSFTTDFANDVRFRDGDVMPYARAIYPFNGQFDNELSFQADDIIHLTRRIDSDWLEGTLSGKAGMFPESYVQVVVPLKGDNSTISDKRSSSAGDGIGFAIVRHDFEGRQKDELSIHMGDSVRVLEMVNADWVKCRDPNTEVSGIVPIAFLEMYLDDEDDEIGNRNSKIYGGDQTFATLNDQSFTPPTAVPDWRTSTRIEQPPIPASAPTKHEWATFGETWLEPEKKSAPPARPPPPKNTVFGSAEEPMLSVEEMFGMPRKDSQKPVVPIENLTPELQKEKRNKVFEELISSELQFITDVQAFSEAVDSNSRFNQKQKAIMKNGYAQITQLATGLVQRLTNEQCKEWDQQTIGSCFLDLRKPFAQTYGYYFKNIEHVNALVSSSTSDPKMEDALSELVAKMRNNGASSIDAATAVSRPIQRCVKYPLFLNEIAKYTPIHHPDHPKLLEAVKLMSTLGQKMNESKRRKELTRKYSQEQSSSSFGDMISKFTVHSIKKKSNRFTYRMGSSLGVVKLARDVDFDSLVSQLDACERSLVRFNYMLVIYKKKMFFETKQLIQKRLIEMRKKQVSLGGINVERQVQPFHEEVKHFAEQLNSMVRDEIVKALRAIPKKLIKKRNDKLMDWEAARSSNKPNASSKNLDFEALNAQVKQTLPKVIEVLFKVLKDAMTTVRQLDDHLTTQLKSKYKDYADDAATDPYQLQRLIVHGIPCFAAYYDPDRLQGLQFIVTRAERKMRVKGAAVAKEEIPIDIAEEALPATNKVASTSTAADFGGRVFRAQTIEERLSILEKAEAKNRKSDIYKCNTAWPLDDNVLDKSKKTGKMLIVNEGDAVLVVKKETASVWFCYNGYYNARLPSTVLTPWYNTTVIGSLDSFTNTKPQSSASLITRPHSTPPKQQVTNLIDLDDFVAPNVTPIIPTAIAPLVPTPVGAAASMHALADPPIRVQAVPVMNNPVSVFDGMRPVDWGILAQAQAPVPWDATPQQRTPSLPNLTQHNPMQSTTPLFPVSFEDSPKDLPSIPVTHLPPTPNTSVTPLTPNPPVDNFTAFWEQIKDQPLNQVTMRSESPQPIIPSRPQPSALNTLNPFSNVPAISPQIQPSYDIVPNMSQYQAPLYSIPPSNELNLSAVQQQHTMSAALYDSTPGPGVLGQYDAPPAESFGVLDGRNKAEIAKVKVNYEFNPTGPNQLAVRAGEILSLIQLQDDDGNHEWVWVRRDETSNGYIPAAYCSRI
ncbi:unnamed protein product [Auanema sp. JU1783]|nr:unnamed protein product [Auanema sp. JU1783]